MPTQFPPLAQAEIDAIQLRRNEDRGPGDSAASGLIKKLTGITLGPQMPLRKLRLNPAQIETLRKWIMDGAPNN